MKAKKTYFSPECQVEDLTPENILCVSNLETLMIDSWSEDDSITPLFLSGQPHQNTSFLLHTAMR